MVVGIRQAGLIISEIDDLLGLSCIIVTRLYTEWHTNKKKQPVNGSSSQRRLASLAPADTKSMESLYSYGEQKSISEAHKNLDSTAETHIRFHSTTGWKPISLRKGREKKSAQQLVFPGLCEPNANE